MSEAGLRGPRLPKSQRPDREGIYRRAKAYAAPGAQARPAPSNGRRVNNRAHLNRWSYLPLHPEGRAQLSTICRHERLRLKHPDDTGPPHVALWAEILAILMALFGTTNRPIFKNMASEQSQRDVQGRRSNSRHHTDTPR